MKQTLSLVMMAALVGVIGCNKNTPTTEVAAASAKSAPAAAIAAPAPDYYETSGPLVVENQIDVLAQRDGFLLTIAVDTGMRVQKGQLLAQMDDRQLQADRDAAESKFKSIEADVKNWEAGLKVIENDYERDQEMFKAGLLTAKQVDHSRYRMVGAGYELERERQNLKTARSVLRSLELELEKTRVTAPFSGVVARRYVRGGQSVKSNDRLFWVTATDPLNVHFTLPDSFLGKISVGSAVTVMSQQAPEMKVSAKVKTVSPVADPSSGTIEVLAELSSAPAAMMPGTNAVVRVAKAK
ncbi:MAG TPA: efflux RND transporter periplasmic adaptor subunit [Terriglobales bacterium]|nr:efflux RND transporter periplasmic adaptor subunit [Terriglobales bacterium]